MKLLTSRSGMVIAMPKGKSSRKLPRRPHRGRPQKELAKARPILVGCGGKVTEPGYFEIAKSELKATAVDVRVPKEGKDPLQLVRYAVKLKKSDRRENPKDSYVSVWAVTDVDDFNNLGEAQKLAKKEGVNLAISNPCFEVWMIDHVQRCPESCYTTRKCEELAVKLGVVHGERAGASRAKQVSASKVAGKMSVACAHATEHNTAEKSWAREHTPGRTSDFPVWTDLPRVVEDMGFGKPGGMLP